MQPRDFLNDGSSQDTYNAQPRDFLGDTERENPLASIALAAPRVGEDIIKRGYQAIRGIPGAYDTAKEQLSGLPSSISAHPGHVGQQGLAGIAEMGKNLFNTPHDFINYLTTRLHLFPEDWNQKVQMSRMPDQETENAINQTLGQPTYSGESLVRGIARNTLNIAGSGGLADLLNPMRLTNKGIAKNVVKELNNQVDKHTDMYNNLWDQATKKGLNTVPYDQNRLISNYMNIEPYTTPKQHQSLVDFANNPTLQNAQKAQSDMGILRRAIEEKSRTTPLLGEERKLYDSLYDTEKHIEGNMFTDSSGVKDQKMADKYNGITNSYRQNVVPYRYNPDIQSYLNKELTAKELVQRLNKGEFAAKKGSAHPAFGFRNALLPLLGGVGAIGGGKYLYDQAMGNPATDQKENQ